MNALVSLLKVNAPLTSNIFIRSVQNAHQIGEAVYQNPIKIPYQILQPNFAAIDLADLGDAGQDPRNVVKFLKDISHVGKSLLELLHGS